MALTSYHLRIACEMISIKPIDDALMESITCAAIQSARSVLQDDGIENLLAIESYSEFTTAVGWAGCAYMKNGAVLMRSIPDSTEEQ